MVLCKEGASIMIKYVQWTWAQFDLWTICITFMKELYSVVVKGQLCKKRYPCFGAEIYCVTIDKNINSVNSVYFRSNLFNIANVLKAMRSHSLRKIFHCDRIYFRLNYTFRAVKYNKVSNFLLRLKFHFPWQEKLFSFQDIAKSDKGSFS